MGLIFSVTSLGPGSITAELADGGTHVQLTASYLSDALGDLTRLVIGMLQGAPQARCAWQEEPGEYRWLFERTGNRAHLRVPLFPQTFSKQPDDAGRCQGSRADSMNAADPSGAHAGMVAALFVVRSNIDDAAAEEPAPPSLLDRARCAVASAAAG